MTSATAAPAVRIAVIDGPWSATKAALVDDPAAL
jgi:hypothetical protein